MPKKTLFVAVIGRDSNTLSSQRSNGTWSSFLSYSKDDAVQQALDAMEQYGSGYKVFVGELTDAVMPVTRYGLKPIN
jgi:hypothetical protein